MLKQLVDRANILTYLGLLVAMFGVHMCFINRTDIAIICLAFCGICDGFDGTFAKKVRKTKDEGFGTQLDSLVDVLSSGMFPIIICYSIGFNKPINMIVYFVFILSGVIRLSYYNIYGKDDSKSFTGIPITTSTIVLPILYYFFRNEIAIMIALVTLRMFIC